MTTTIRHDDLVESIAAALQYISYYHPADYIAHLARAYQRVLLEKRYRSSGRGEPDGSAEPADSAADDDNLSAVLTCHRLSPPS